MIATLPPDYRPVLMRYAVRAAHKQTANLVGLSSAAVVPGFASTPTALLPLVLRLLSADNEMDTVGQAAMLTYLHAAMQDAPSLDRDTFDQICATLFFVHGCRSRHSPGEASSPLAHGSKDAYSGTDGAFVQLAKSMADEQGIRLVTFLLAELRRGRTNADAATGLARATTALHQLQLLTSHATSAHLARHLRKVFQGAVSYCAGYGAVSADRLQPAGEVPRRRTALVRLPCGLTPRVRCRCGERTHGRRKTASVQASSLPARAL